MKYVTVGKIQKENCRNRELARNGFVEEWKLNFSTPISASNHKQVVVRVYLLCITLRSLRTQIVAKMYQNTIDIFFPLKRKRFKRKINTNSRLLVPIRDFSLRLFQCTFSFIRFPARFIEFTQLSPTRHVRIYSRYNFNLHCKQNKRWRRICIEIKYNRVI